MPGLLYNRPLGRLSRRWWFEAAAYADLAAIADFNLDRYAITIVPLANIAAATAAELCVKRACTFAEWFAFTCSSTGARSYFDAGGIWRNDLAVDRPRFSWINGKRQLALSAQAVNACTSNNAGGVAGVLGGGGGSLPAGWSYTFNSSMTLTVSYPTVNGLPICRVRITGTPTSTGGQYLNFEGNAVVAAGSASAVSVFAALQGGALAGTSVQLRHTQAQSGLDITPNAALGRYADARTITGTNAQCCIRFGFPDTVTPQDFTLDIAVPQREAGAPFISPPIIGPAGTTRAIETAEMSPALEAILQRSAASIVVRGQNFLRAQGMMIGVNGGSALLRSATARTTAVIDGSASLVSGGGLSFETNAWAAASAFDAAGRGVVRNGGTVTSDAGTPPGTRTAAYLGRNGSGTLYGDGWYDWVGIAPSRLSNARLAELAVAA